jgi:hypothetical protein
LLEQFNPGVRSAIVHLAETAASDGEIVGSATREAYARIAAHANDNVQLDRRSWSELSAGLQRETLREAVRELKGNVTHLKFATIEEARAVLNSDARTGTVSLMTDLIINVGPEVFQVRRFATPN